VLRGEGRRRGESGAPASLHCLRGNRSGQSDRPCSVRSPVPSMLELQSLDSRLAAITWLWPTCNITEPAHLACSFSRQVARQQQCLAACLFNNALCFLQRSQCIDCNMWHGTVPTGLVTHGDRSNGFRAYLSIVVLVQVRDGDVSTLTGKGQCDGPADARVRTGDQSNLPQTQQCTSCARHSVL
jgi:hypothetical protein